MKRRTNRPEVLAPAGDMECLIAAVTYGADAVYLGSTAFGMRAASANFDFQTLREACDYAHSHGVKVYLTCNTVPHNNEISALPDFLRGAADCGVDAFIISDMGVFMIAKEVAPQVEIHISTQAGIVNYASANAWAKLGAARVVLAREMSMKEIAQLCEKIPETTEVEAFVHGAMCMSISGRCLLSSYMTGRDPNRGACAQPCRWNYHLVEEKRPGQYFPIGEDENGSYILNAKDMCLLPYIGQIIDSGVTSLKIEGRAKSSYYVSVVTNAYRMAVDEYLKDPEHFVLPDWLNQEITKVSHRRYSTGFYFNTPDQYYETGGYIRSYDVMAIIDDWKDGVAYATQKNKFSVGDTGEILMPKSKPFTVTIEKICDHNGEEVPFACHPQEKISFPCETPLKPGSIFRMARFGEATE